MIGCWRQRDSRKSFSRKINIWCSGSCFPSFRVSTFQTSFKKARKFRPGRVKIQDGSFPLFERQIIRQLGGKFILILRSIYDYCVQSKPFVLHQNEGGYARRTLMVRARLKRVSVPPEILEGQASWRGKANQQSEAVVLSDETCTGYS